MPPKSSLNNVTNKLAEQTDQNKNNNPPPPLHLPTPDFPSAVINESYQIDTQRYFEPVSIPDFRVPANEIAQDIDAPDLYNPYTVSVYADEAYRYLFDLQVFLL